MVKLSCALPVVTVVPCISSKSCVVDGSAAIANISGISGIYIYIQVVKGYSAGNYLCTGSGIKVEQAGTFIETGVVKPDYGRSVSSEIYTAAGVEVNYAILEKTLEAVN